MERALESVFKGSFLYFLKLLSDSAIQLKSKSIVSFSTLDDSSGSGGISLSLTTLLLNILQTEWGYVYGKTYSEVKEKLNVKKFESKSNKAVVSVNMSLYDWIDKWIATQRQIKPTTKMMY